ncbi:MAG: hypothetical protein WAZ31_05565 [Rectinemataceae bacterium]
MTGIFVAPLPAGRDDPIAESLPSWEQLKASASALGAVCRTGNDGFFAAFDLAAKGCRLGLFLFMDGICEVFSAAGATPESYSFHIDSSHGGVDELKIRMGARTSSLARLGKPGSVLVSQAASEACTALFGPGASISGEDTFSDFGPVTAFGMSSRIAALIPPVRTEEIARLKESLLRAGNGERTLRLIAVLGPPHTASRLIEGYASSLKGYTSESIFRIFADPRAANPLSPLLRALDAFFAEHLKEFPKTPASGSEVRRDFGPDDLAAAVERLAASPWRASQSADRIELITEATAYCLSRSAAEMRTRKIEPFSIVHDAEYLHRECLSVLEAASALCGADAAPIMLSGRTLPRDAHFKDAVTLRTSGLSFFDTIQSLRSGRISFREGALLREPVRKPESAQSRMDSGDAAKKAQAAAQDPLRLALLIASTAFGTMVPEESPDRDTPTGELALTVLRRLPREIAEYLLLKSLASILPSARRTDALIETCGFPAVTVRVLERYLDRLGFMMGPSGDASMPAAFSEIDFESVLSDSGRAISESFSDAVRGALLSGTLRPSIAALRRLLPFVRFDDGEGVRLALDCTAAEASDGDSENPPIQPSDHEIASWLRFAKALASGDGKPLADAAAAFEKDAPPGAIPIALRALAEACAEYEGRRPLNSAARGKAALMALKNRGLPREEAVVQRILGLCELAQGRLIQGAAYLSNAYETAEIARDSAEAARSLLEETGCSFLMGDFGRAALLLGIAGEKAARSLDPEALCAVRFATGRMNMELGRMDSAHEAFRDTEILANRFSRDRTAFRAVVWAGAASHAVPPLSPREGADAEALRFASEAALARGDRTEARQLSRLAVDAAVALGQGFASAGPFSWRDGYSGLEGLYAGYAGHRSLLMDRAIAWDAYCGGLSGDADPLEAAMLLQSFAREDRIAHPHPFAHLYLYWLYDLAAAGLAPGFDVPSAISRAFKALQTRAARIDDSLLLDDFMNRNPDHAKIIAAARRHRLM